MASMPEIMARYTPEKLAALMQDAGIVRNRLKIEASVTNAQAYLAIPDFSAYLWDFHRRHAAAEPAVAAWRQVPAKTPLAEKMSKDLQKRGFRFVGPTIVYAFMQACGLVNDHLVDCHRHEAGEACRVQPLKRRAPGSACCRGGRLDLLDPSPLDIEIEDIAHGLARVARWNGQTKGDHAFSVAQHCVLVEQIAAHLDPDSDRPARLAALLHDAPEYVIGDMISPFKAALGYDYKAFEKRLMAAIHIRFGLARRSAPRSSKPSSRKPTASPPISKQRSWPDFDVAEAEKFFGRPQRARRRRLGEVLHS